MKKLAALGLALALAGCGTAAEWDSYWKHGAFGPGSNAAAAMILTNGPANAYATPLQVPQQQRTNCRPDFLGGFRCTSH